MSVLVPGACVLAIVLVLFVAMLSIRVPSRKATEESSRRSAR